MEAPQKTGWIKAFIDHLRVLIKGPPYLVVFFVSTILLIVSISQPMYINTFLAIFLYSILGITWRHAAKDIRGRLEEAYPSSFTKTNLWFTLVYHLINLLVFCVLIYVIVRYCI